MQALNPQSQNAASESDPPARSEEAGEALVAQLNEVYASLPEWLQPYAAYTQDHPMLAALVVSVVFVVLAYAVRFLVIANLERLAARTSTTIDNALISHLRRPIFTTIVLFGLMLAVNIAQLPVATKLLVSILASAIVVSWMVNGMKLSGDILAYFNNRRDVGWVEPRTIPAIDLVVKLTLILFGSYVLLLVWGINPLGWLASAGIVGIAVGFAAKDTLANLFAGFFIVADAPYKIGDYINLDTGERGQVTHIGMRSTRLLTRDDVEITVPNGVMGNAKITNESGGRHQKVRIRIDVGVAYGSDVDDVVELLRSIGAQHEETCLSPEPRVRMRGFADSSLTFQLLVWIDHPEDRGRVAHDLYMTIYKGLADAGITIPFPQRDVHLHRPESDV